MSSAIRTTAPLIALTVVAGFLLWPAIVSVPMWDDIYTLRTIDETARHGRPVFAPTGDMILFWRPLELVINALLRPLDPAALAPVKIASIFFHLLKILAVALLVGRLVKTSAVATIVAGVVALFHPAAVSAIIQIDTISESIVAASIAWALLLMLLAVDEDDGRRRALFATVVLLCVVTILGKESGAPVVAVLPVVGFIAASKRRRILPDLIAMTVILGAIGIAYLLVRSGLGFGKPTNTGGRYDITLGLNVPVNLATVAAFLAYFGNTLALIGDRAWTALSGFIPLLLAAPLIVVAFVRHRREMAAILDGRGLLACSVVAIAATIAPALAPMISENNAAPASAAVLAVVFALVIAAARVCGRTGTTVAVLAAATAIVLGAVATRQKAVATANVGAVVETTRAQIARFAADHDRIRLCVTPREGRQYSIYRLPAERWMLEEAEWTRHLFPTKTVDLQINTSGRDCDISVPNFSS